MAKRLADIDEKARAVARAGFGTKSLEGHGPRLTIGRRAEHHREPRRPSPLEARRVLARLPRRRALAAVPVVAIWSADEETRTLTPVAVLARRREASARDAALRPRRHRLGRREPDGAGVADVFADARFIATTGRRSHRLSSFCGVPLVLDDRMFGVLALDGPDPIALTRLSGSAWRAWHARGRVCSTVSAMKRTAPGGTKSSRPAGRAAARDREMAALIAASRTWWGPHDGVLEALPVS